MWTFASALPASATDTFRFTATIVDATPARAFVILRQREVCVCV